MPFHCCRRLTSPSETNNRKEKNFGDSTEQNSKQQKDTISGVFFTLLVIFQRVIFFYIFNGLEFIFLCFVSLFFHLHFFLFSALRCSFLAYHHVVWRSTKQQSENPKERQRKAAKTTRRATRRAWTHHLVELWIQKKSRGGKNYTNSRPKEKTE